MGCFEYLGTHYQVMPFAVSKSVLNPENLLNFIETKVFTDSWENLRLSDDDLFVLQMAIMSAPKASPVIPGTGGLRKLRFSSPSWSRGKSGSLRVCYVYFEEYGIVLLVIVYSKSEKDNLSEQQKKTIKQLIKRQKNELSKRPIK